MKNLKDYWFWIDMATDLSILGFITIFVGAIVFLVSDLWQVVFIGAVLIGLSLIPLIISRLL